MKRLSWVIVVSLALAAKPAYAVFGEENATLFQIMWENIEQSLKLRDLLETTRQMSDLARETAGFARASVQVTRNVQAIINDPHRYFNYAVSTWYYQFPELHETLANAYTARELFDDATHPSNLPEYDAYAYNRAFDALAMMNRSGFEVLAHAVDVYGVNDPHDKAIAGLRTQYQMAQDNLRKLADVLNTTGLSPVESGIYTAQATALTATAMQQATATLEHMSRTMELEFQQQRVSEMNGQILGVEQDAAGARLHLKSWALDPMRSRIQPEGR